MVYHENRKNRYKSAHKNGCPLAPEIYVISTCLTAGHAKLGTAQRMLL